MFAKIFKGDLVEVFGSPAQHGLVQKAPSKVGSPLSSGSSLRATKKAEKPTCGWAGDLGAL